MYIKQYVKKTVSCIAMMIVITASGTAEAQLTQMMRPDELGIGNRTTGVNARTGVSQQRVPTTAQQVMNKKPETNTTTSESGASVKQETKTTGQSTQGSSSILDLTKDHGGVLDTTKNYGGVLDKLQEQGNAGTTQSGTSVGQSGSGTGTAGSAPSSTGVGPTKNADDVLKQRNQQTTGAMSPFAQFAPTQTNQKQNEGTGSSYFGTSSSMDTLAQMNHAVQEKQAAALDRVQSW